MISYGNPVHPRQNSLYIHEKDRASVSALDVQPNTKVARHMNQTLSSICRQNRKTLQKYGSKYNDEDQIKNLMKQIKLKKQSNNQKRDQNNAIRKQLRDELQKSHKLQHELPPTKVPLNSVNATVEHSQNVTLRGDKSLIKTKGT